jgi:hypothetical protein
MAGLLAYTPHSVSSLQVSVPSFSPASFPPGPQIGPCKTSFSVLRHPHFLLRVFCVAPAAYQLVSFLLRVGAVAPSTSAGSSPHLVITVAAYWVLLLQFCLACLQLRRTFLALFRRGASPRPSAPSPNFGTIGATFTPSG